MFRRQSAGLCGLGVLAGAPSLPEKHFPRVWQLEQNKRLLFAGCRNASHNTQLTACSPVIHSQELGVPGIRKKRKKKKYGVLCCFITHLLT